MSTSAPFYRTSGPLIHPTRGFRVRCSGCGWRGYRHGYPGGCECYPENAMYCRPWSPGAGCPSWVTYPCPKGCLRDGKPFLFSTRDSLVDVVYPKRRTAR